MPQVNEIIGPYKLIEELGSGQFGVVWEAERHEAHAAPHCAIKFPARDEIDLEDLKKEARVWAQASGHPNVLPLIEARVYGNRLVIVSEYVEREYVKKDGEKDSTLFGWLSENGGRAPSVESAVEMMDGVLRGLAHLHSRDVIHRDLKPANIMLQRGIPRLADFGLSRVLTSTHSTKVRGTLAYMAPEAFDSERTQQTDIWAAGVILYQLLCGRKPFPQRDEPSLIRAILDPNRPPDPLPADLPAPLREVVMRALEKDSARRFQSAEQMRLALREVLYEAYRQPLPNEHRPGDEYRPDERRPPEKPRERQAATPEIQRLRIDLPETPLQKQKSGGKGGIAVAGVMALLIGVAIYMGNSSSSSPTEPTPELTTPVVTRTPATPKSFTEDLGNGVKLEMVALSGGEFLMGSSESAARAAFAEAQRAYNDARWEWFEGETPPHRVRVGNFWMGRYEVTQAQWEAVMGSNSNPSSFKGDTLPVEQVSWNDAVEFCRKLSSSTGKTYRLPTEAEWEYACRAGTTTPFAFGSSLSSTQANFDGNYPYGGAAKGVYREKTVPVGSYSPNNFGLYDLHGNVWEWCQDWYDSNYYEQSPGTDPQGPGSGSGRVFRGGCWSYTAVFCRAAFRDFYSPGFRYNHLGFRLVRTAR